MTTGVFPRNMKVAKVRALYKAGDSMLLDNYRPISLLPVISKILEKVVYLRLVSHLDVNDVLFPKQFGFRKSHSMTDAFITAVGELLTAFDPGFHMLSVFVDLRKASDTVDHKIILNKLEQLGIRGVAYDWFKSYIMDRRQVVCYQNATSVEEKLSCGVAQGSLLGVILFQLHINDMPQCLKHMSAILYADDTTLYVIGRNPAVLKIKMQHDLNLLSRWLSSNKLMLNVSKTKSIVFSKLSVDGIKLYVNSQEIEAVKCFKFLGYYLDQRLTFEHHGYNLYKTLLSSVHVIRKLSTFIPQSCLKTLYYAYYYSRLSYGIHIWFPLLRSILKSNLVTLQKRLIRIICHKGLRAHCMPLFKSQKILKIDDLVCIENLKLIFHVDANLCPLPVKNLFVRPKHNHCTRRQSFLVSRHNSQMYNNSFLTKGLMAWDSLKPEY